METLVGQLHQQESLAETEPLTRCGVTPPADWRLRSLARPADLAATAPARRSDWRTPAQRLSRPLRVVVTYPTVVAVFEHVVTPVRPIVKTLPRVQNRLRPFNFHHHARFHGTAYLSEFLD